MPVGYRTSDGYDLNDLWYGGPGGGPGIRAAVDRYQEVDPSIITALAMPHGNTVMKYAISEKNGFQRLAPGQRPDRKNLVMAAMYPEIAKHGYGVGTDLDTLQISTGKEVMLDLNRPFLEDPEHVMLQFLKVMMTDPGSANAGYGFYNGQFSSEEKLVAPPKYQNNSFNANHTHYYGTNAAALVLADITAAKQTIQHHGHKGQLVAFINSVEKQRLEDLAAWTGSGIRVLLRDQVAIQGFRDSFELLGVQFYVTEMIPPKYLLMVVASVEEETGRPLIMFEYPNMRGLQLHPGPLGDYPLIESYFTRWMGVKVAQRGAGVAIHIAASTSYTNPTFNE